VAAAAPISPEDQIAKSVRFDQRQLLRRQIDASAPFSDDAAWIRRTLDEIAKLTMEAQRSTEEVGEGLEEADPTAPPTEGGNPADTSPAVSLQQPVLADRPLAPPPSLSAARARTAQQAAAAAAQDWAKCAASHFQTNVRHTGRSGAADGALRACTGAEQTTRGLVRSALEARSGRTTSEEVERNMDAARAAIRGALD
jgi:hypothetical protein